MAGDIYFARAIASLRELAQKEVAFAEMEAVAKLIEPHFESLPFEPHHLTAAKNYMLKSGEIFASSEPTRGGRQIPLLIADVAMSSKSVDERAARKRLLLARYYGWSEGLPSVGEGVTGPAAEIAFQGALQRASVGTSLATTFRDRPSVPVMFGEQIPDRLGPFDNLVLLQPLTPDLSPRPPYGVFVPIEIKNIREWIYPHSKQLFQLLHKASAIQARHPDRPMIPVLVSRRRHITTGFMAKALGFFVVEARRHYFPLHSRVEPERLQEVRVELGLADITQDLAQTKRVETGLHNLQSKYDVELAVTRWSLVSNDSYCRALFADLHKVDLQEQRKNLMDELRMRTSDLGLPSGW